MMFVLGMLLNTLRCVGQPHHGEWTEPSYHMLRLRSPGLMIEAIQDLSSLPSQRAMSFRKCAGLVSRTIFFRELFLNLFRGVGKTHSEEIFHKHMAIISADFLLRFPSNDCISPVEMGYVRCCTSQADVGDRLFCAFGTICMPLYLILHYCFTMKLSLRL
uniref:Uncharacterized protein n=1 Tax=Nomascus leucogenys TaxID=61853 RepID=A0A2I3HFS7_NOMLE